MNSALSSEGSEQIRSLFREFVALEPRERDRQLERIDLLDPAIARELLSLLEAHDRSPEVLDRLDRLLAGPAQSPSDTSSPSLESTDPLLGRQISHYQILEKLGGGGMGVVYRARDLRLERTVALKFLPPHLSLDKDVKQRFIREARAASALDHPNICTIYDIDESPAEGGAPAQLFIAMAYYPGETLKKKIERGPLPVPYALEYARQIAEGLQRAHAAGIVHRDIKPANVLVTERGEVKLVDFGIAKVIGEGLTRTGLPRGTVAYMSPEQGRGEPVDQRTDLWSLGVVLYEMLTGQRPFRGHHEQAVLYSIERCEPEPLESFRNDVPPELARLIRRCLTKDPAERYRTAELLLADLRIAAEAVGDHHSTGAAERRVGRTAHPSIATSSSVRLTPNAAPAGGAAWRKHLSSHTMRWRAWGGVTALLVVGLPVILLSRMGSESREIPAQPRAEAAPRFSSLAVLPVVNLSGEPEHEVLADGMTDLLITQLSGLSGFDRVISRTSVMQYRGAQKSLPEIGAELGVDGLIEASMLFVGERVRIDVNLLEATTERNLWSQSFERPLRDVLALQRDVALAIAREVEVTLTSEDRERLSDAPAIDPEAFQLYVRGTQARYRGTGEDFQEARDFFEQALARDPNYAPAHAGLAFVHAFTGDEVRAHGHAQKALELDPNLAEAYVAFGLIRQFYDWDWAGAEAAFRQAIELNPGYAEAHHELSMLLMRLRRFDEALREAQVTLYLAPMSARFEHGIGEVYLSGGQYDEALAAAVKTLALDPNYEWAVYYLQALAYGQQGRYAEAIDAWQKSIALGCEAAYGALGWTYAVSGRVNDAQQVLELLIARGDGGVRIAQVYLGLGEREQALDWLERAVIGGGAHLYLAIDPILRPLHVEPRFQALLKRMGLD